MTKVKEHISQNKEKNIEKNFIDHVVDIRRVTKVTKGGKRFAFSAFVVTGDGQGKVGFALAKSKEVSLAIAKATSRARKNMIHIPLRGATVPYEVTGYHGACKVIVKPASKGTGNVAGSAVRAIMSSVGIGDVLTKVFGSLNGQNVAKATMHALAQLRSSLQIAKLRGTTVEKIVKGA